MPCSWTTDFRFAARTFLDFSNSLFLSMLNTIAVYCAENWKLLLARTLLHFCCAMRSKKIRLRWLSSDARKLSVFSFFIISFHVAEKSVHISSRLLVCVCTFLLVDKIVYGLLAFGNACFSFCIKSFQIFSLIKLAWRMFVRNFGKISIFLAFSGSFAVKNDNFAVFFLSVFRCFGCKFWVCRLFFQNKNTRLSWKRSDPDRERTNQSTRICLRLTLPYNNAGY